MIQNIMAESCPNLGRDAHTGTVAFENTRQHQKASSLHYFIIKPLTIQNKERTLKMARETHQTAYKGRTIRITSTETLKAWKAWGEISASYKCDRGLIPSIYKELKNLSNKETSNPTKNMGKELHIVFKGAALMNL